MKKQISWLAMVFTAMFLMMLAGCGGGGGGGAAQPVAACVENSWSPDPATVPIGQNFQQTSNCPGITRSAVGTLDTWINRGGAKETALFKSYSSTVMSSITASPDGNGGLIALGRNSASVNNKAVLTRLDASGNELWRKNIDVPLGNTLIPHPPICDGQHIVVMQERLPLHDLYITAFDMIGNAVTGEININGPAPTTSDWSDWLLSSANVIIDGGNLVISRIQQSGNSGLFYANMAGGTPLAVAPLFKPEFVTVDSTGINVIGQGQYMKYARDLSVLQVPQALPQFDTIKSVITVDDKTYVAGTLAGTLVLSELGNPAFRNTKNLAVGTDNVSLSADAAGNIYVSVGNRFGLIDKATGDFVTQNPAAVPVAPGFVSGNKYFSVSGTSTIEALPLSRVQ